MSKSKKTIQSDVVVTLQWRMHPDYQLVLSGDNADEAAREFAAGEVLRGACHAIISSQPHRGTNEK